MAVADEAGVVAVRVVDGTGELEFAGELARIVGDFVPTPVLAFWLSSLDSRKAMDPAAAAITASIMSARRTERRESCRLSGAPTAW